MNTCILFVLCAMLSPNTDVRSNSVFDMLSCFPAQVKVLQPVDCAVVCSRTELSEQETNQFVEKIADDYTAHL